MNAPVNIADLRLPPVMRVMPENIMPLWPQLEPLIEVELRTIPTHDAEDVRKLLIANQAHLWIQWRDAVESMAITDFIPHPRGLALRVWMGAALPGTKMALAEYLKVITQWARLNRCRWIDVCGRPGWMRVFPQADYAGMFMRITVDWSAP